MTYRDLLFALPLLLAACVEDVGSGKTAVTVAEPVAQSAKVDGQRLAIDASRSKVHALGAKITARHPIVFDRWTGALLVDGDALVGVEVTIEMDSLRADVDKLTGHLKTADFFDVATYPQATFVSSSIAPSKGKDGTHQVTGALTMHGVTRNVAFPAVVTHGDRLEARAEFVIDRQDYGIAYPGMPDDLIQDNVVLTIELSASPS